MTSVLDRITEEHVHSDPFSYLSTTEALEPNYYESLAAHFPDFADLVRIGGRDDQRKRLSENNMLMHRSGLDALVDDTPIHPVWQNFMRFHFSHDFYRQVIRHLGDGIRQTYPDLEQHLGKSLEELTVQPRYTKDQGADLWIDVNFAINTPVRKASRVRARHVDDPRKLFFGLFYMRAPEDDSIGGDLEICRWRGAPQFKNLYVSGHEVNNTHIQDHQVDLVNTVNYRANTLILSVASAFAIHGVTERQLTSHFRRYINLMAEFREPIYDIRQYQANSEPWALMMGSPSPG